jgi:calcineurin-like phosphoesterase family protein
MTAVYFTADTHFCHRMVADLRGFGSSEEHDEAIIANWNRVVRPSDLVWHLGDVGLGNEARILAQAARLNGHKQLITGNHDACWPGNRGARSRQRRWLEVFESVQAFARIRLEGRPVLLSHFPYEDDHTDERRHGQYRLRDEGMWLLHGHTHRDNRISQNMWQVPATMSSPAEDRGREVHVGLDAWTFCPAGEAAVVRVIKEYEDSVAVVAEQTAAWMCQRIAESRHS